MTIMIIRRIIIIAFFLLTECALQGPPTGGAVDNVPPIIIEQSPDPQSTEVDLSAIISCTFNEEVDRRSAEQSFFISPRPRKPVEFRWKGNKIEILFPGGLDSGTTYVFTIGTSLSDLRNNKLETPVQWAFSTGDKLDEGIITGIVLEKEIPAKAEIWAYRLSEPDTVHPSRMYPHYITSTDNNGEYRLNNLRSGKYRIYAINDQNRNGLYDLGFDNIGIPSKDIEATDENPSPFLWIRMSKEDTTGPRLLQARSLDREHILLLFSEPVNERKLPSIESIHISFNQEYLSVRNIAFPENSFNSFLVLTEPQKEGILYSIKVELITDPSGNAVISGFDTSSFYGTANPDTISPYIVSIEPSDSLQRISASQSIHIQFSEIMEQLSVEKGIELHQLEADILPLKFEWIDGARLHLTPINYFSSGQKYELIVNSERITDPQQNTLIDSIFSRILVIFDSSETGTISGSIEQKLSTESQSFQISLKTLNKGEFFAKIAKKNPGFFNFPLVPPGKYILDGFVDRDGDGEYFNGSTTPHFPSEHYIRSENPIEVRPGWDVEEVVLYFFE